MADKDDIPLESIDKQNKADAKPNGDNDAPPYGYTVTVDSGADDTLLVKSGRNDDKAAMKARLASNDFTGLTKEELAKFSKDPYWRKVRIILFVLFWLIWVALLVAAIVIIVVTPKCPPRPEIPFYQKDAVYKVLPLSFAVKDGGDGWGHLIGLESKLTYIQSLGASTVEIGPVFTAKSKANALYDSIGNKEVDMNIGHFSPCLQKVTKSASKLGMKVIIDAQINFASVFHPLFVAQVTGTSPTAGPFLVRQRTSVKGLLTARDGKSAWRDVSAVIANATAGLVYYSSFNADVVEWDFNTTGAVNYTKEMVKTLLAQDIDGVVIKDASFLFECSDLANVSETDPAQDAADFGSAFWKLAHPCTMNQNASGNLVRELAGLVAQRNQEDDRRKRVLLVELAGIRTPYEYATFVGSGLANGAYLDTLTHVTYANGSCDTACVRRRVEAVSKNAMQKRDTPILYPMWQFSTPEFGRFTTRFGTPAAAFFTLGTFLPGGFGTYYGDEVAVTDVSVSRGELDKLFFDNRFRSTMQWTNVEPYAGFLTPAKPNTTLDAGLVGPKDPNSYLTANALVHQADGFADSRILLLRKLLQARKQTESAQWGTFYSLSDALLNGAPALRSSLIAFARVAIGFDPVVVVINGLGDALPTQVGSLPLGKVVCDALRSSAEWGSAMASNAKLFTCESGSVIFSSGSSAVSAGSSLSLSNVYFGQNQVLILRVPKASS